MPEHTTIEDNIHVFSSHEIKEELDWQSSTQILLYAVAEYKAATVVMRLTANNLKIMKFVIEVVDDGTNANMDVVEIAADDSNRTSYSFSVAVSGGNVVLTITNPSPLEFNDLKYYVIPSAL